MANSPFIRDVPAAQAMDAWYAALEAAGCPERVPAIEVPLAEALGLVTAAPVWAPRSSPPFDSSGMDGIAVTAADTVGASETVAVHLAPDAYDVVDTGDPMPPGRDAVRMSARASCCCRKAIVSGLLTWRQQGRRGQSG